MWGVQIDKIQFIKFPSMQSAHVPMQNDKGVIGKSTQEEGFQVTNKSNT